MVSVSLLLTATRPKPESEGLVDVGPAVVRVLRDNYPAQRKLYLAFFVSRNEPFVDMEMRTEIVLPNGTSPDAARKVVPLQGSWDFATGSVDLGHVHFPEPGQYAVNMYVKVRTARHWPDEPHCFWLIYATTPDDGALVSDATSSPK